MKYLYCFLCARCHTQPSTGTICRAVCRFQRHIDYHSWLAKIPKSRLSISSSLCGTLSCSQGFWRPSETSQFSGVMEYNIGRSTQRVENALGYQYVQLDNQQDRRSKNWHTQLRVSRLGYIWQMGSHLLAGLKYMVASIIEDKSNSPYRNVSVS